MLHIAIGLGIHSVEGAAIERMLLQKFEPDMCIVHPVKEEAYRREPLQKIQRRVVHYTDEVKLIYPALIHIGIASGVARFKDEKTKDTNYVRYDIATLMEKNTHGLVITPYLNYGDMHWQLKNQVIGLRSTEESIARLSILVHKAFEKMSVQK